MTSPDAIPPFPGSRPEIEPHRQGASENLRFTIRKLIRGTGRASLATILPAERRPYVSLVTVATDFDGSPLLLLSRLAEHTRNIDVDPHVSLLFDGTEGYANPQQGPRVSLVGRIEFCNQDRCRDRFITRHPGATLYAGFADFAFYKVPLDRGHFVGGFGRAVWCDELACSDRLSQAFADAAPALLEQINRDDPALVAQLANKVLRRRGKNWRVIALDPDGCDLERDSVIIRLPFEAPLSGVAEVREALQALATRATENS